MKKIPAIIFICMSVHLIGYADLVYNFDFEEPDYTVGTQLASGAGYVADGNVFVRTGLADFLTQVASLEPAGSLSFGVAPEISSGVVSISWDIALITLGTPAGSSAAFGIASTEGGGIFSASFDGDGTLHDAYGLTLGVGYNLGSYNHIHLLIDLDADLVDFLVDGNLVVDDSPISPTISPTGIVFSRRYETSPHYAIDNFRWEIIPEPSSLGLALCGILALAAAKTKSFRNRRRLHGPHG